jgi:catechol 2,3-dioxygenase-like lactoylglutathione lyase family enzyme
MSNRSAYFALWYGTAFALLAAAVLPQTGRAQSPGAPQSADGPSPVRGIYNWIHTTGDADRAFPFYRDVFGIELAASPFGGNANGPSVEIRPASEAASDSLIWNLTNTEGSRFRNAFMRTANTPFGLELTEFFDIPRNTRPANPWDPGASILIFEVRNLEAVASKLKARAAPIVTLGGTPLATPAGRSILARDPDGYPIRVIQASPGEIAGARSADEIVNTAIGISVADTPAALEFYGDLLGFDVGETRRATEAELQLHGLAEGELTETATRIPGTEASFFLLEFELPPGASVPAFPFRWRIQDVGAPQFQLEVAGLDALIERTMRAGYRFLSIDAAPIERAFGRFVFAIDPDGVLVEFVEPTARE